MTYDELVEQSYTVEGNVGFYRGTLCQVRDGKPVPMNMQEYMDWLKQAESGIILRPVDKQDNLDQSIEEQSDE